MSDVVDIQARNLEIFDLTEDGMLQIEHCPLNNSLVLCGNDNEVNLRKPYNLIGLTIVQDDQTIPIPNDIVFLYFKTLIGGLP